jgi:hypothetical protein
MLATNIVIALATIQILRTYARRERLRVSGERPVATSSETDFQRLIAQE